MGNDALCLGTGAKKIVEAARFRDLMPVNLDLESTEKVNMKVLAQVIDGIYFQITRCNTEAIEVLHNKANGMFQLLARGMAILIVIPYQGDCLGDLAKCCTLCLCKLMSSHNNGGVPSCSTSCLLMREFILGIHILFFQSKKAGTPWWQNLVSTRPLVCRFFT